jgi:hypothetical protein
MANTDQKLIVTELDFDGIKNNLKNFLRDQQEFSDFDFEASGMSVLLDILAYNTHYMSFYNNMIANEMFLDTAVLRNSVVSHAKMLGYTPSSTVGSRATVNLQISRPSGNTQTTLTLPKFSRFQSAPFNGVSFTFVNLTSKVAEYDSTCDRFCFGDLFIYQGQPLTYSFTYDAASNITQSFELPDAGIDVSSIQVFVQDSATSLRKENYILATDATEVTSTSNVYYLDESKDGKYKIYFGDDVIGKKLVNGNIVIVTYIKTDGAAANKVNAFSLIDSVGGFTNSIIFPVKAASGGSDREPIDRIRFSAPKAYISNNRGVTKDDIIGIINQKYPYFEAVNVWGGEDNDPPIYGKVFVAAKPSIGFEITESEKLNVINNVIKPICVVTVIPEFVDVDYNYIRLFIEVFYTKSKTNRSTDDLKTIIRNSVVDFRDKQLDNFNSKFKLSRLLRNIDDADASISYSDAEVVIEKRLIPQIGAARNYTLDYGTELSREDPKFKISSTPAFKQFDNEGVVRSCFFEEVPGTSSGVEAVRIVTAPRTDYLTAPTIVISGDGVGANAYPIIVNGKITQIIVDNPGVNYRTAAANIYYEDELDTTVSLTTAIQGRYGVIRSFFFDDNNIKTILNPEAGVVDYLLGKITLRQFDPTSIEDPLKILRFNAKPARTSFESARSRILTIDDESLGSINITMTPLD